MNFLEFLLSSNKYDIICLVETFLTVDDRDSLYLIGGKKYTLFRYDKLIHRGGVAIFCKSSLCPVRNFISHIDVQYIHLKINSKIPFNIICVYRPPNCNEVSHEQICKLFDITQQNYNSSIIIGDFNLPNFNWKDYTFPSYPKSYALLFDSIIKNSFSQLINKPTRNNNIIDLLFTNEKQLLSNINIGDYFGLYKNISDHYSVSFNVNIEKYPCKQILKSNNFDFNNSNIKLIKYHLSRFNWEYLNSNDYNIDQKVEYFNNVLNKLFISHIPNINNTIKQVLPKNILKLKKQVKKLFRKSKTNLQYKYNWIEAKKKLSKELESLNFKREINAINSKNKLKFYKFMKKRQNLKSGVSPLIDISNNNILFSDLDKANTLNSYFSSIQQNDNGNLPEFYNLTKQKFDNIDLNLEIIKIFLNRLKITHTFGTDGIPSSMLKVLSNELCRPLYIIFNSSLLSGNIPKIWKKSIITPIFKKGEPSNSNNYRPISITCVMCRVLERIISKQLIFYLKSNNLLTKYQYGFISGKSTELQLTKCLKFWYNELNNKKCVDIIYIDFAKAFDVVSHEKLLFKLKSYGISNKIIKWFYNFLSNRSQITRVENSFSNSSIVKSGVPQGSVLGPILFVLYINDLPSIFSSKIHIDLFADDTKIYFSYASESERFLLQNNLNLFSQWVNKWQLNISLSKCAVMTLGKVTPSKYFINNIQLENVTFYKDLGIIFENNLLFNKHIDYICKKAYFSLNSIFRCITTKSPRALLNAYKIYCRPILEYASIIWSPFSKVSKFRSLIDQIERVQRLFTRRLITRCVGYTNSSNINYKSYIERLVYFKLESLELRRLKIDLTTIFKISNNYTDINISDILNISNNCRTRGNCKKLNVIHNYDNTIKNIINNRSVNIWNSLNNDIIKSVSVSSFKNKINKICFDKLLFFNRNL